MVLVDEPTEDIVRRTHSVGVLKRSALSGGRFRFAPAMWTLTDAGGNEVDVPRMDRE